MNILAHQSQGTFFAFDCWDLRSGIRCVLLLLNKNNTAVIPIWNSAAKLRREKR